MGVFFLFETMKRNSIAKEKAVLDVSLFCSSAHRHEPVVAISFNVLVFEPPFQIYQALLRFYNH